MKSHFVSIRFKNVFGKDYIFQGRVLGRQEADGRVTINACKLFRNAFGFELPDYTSFLIG